MTDADTDWHSEWNWDKCVARYESLKSRTESDNYYHVAATKMLELISRIRQDTSFPEVTTLVSHASLRLGLPSVKFQAPDLSISWVETDEFALGFGLFGGFERAIVPWSKIIPAIKHYLNKLQEIRREIQAFRETTNKRPSEDERWSKSYLLNSFARLPHEWLFANVTYSVHDQLWDAKFALERFIDDSTPNRTPEFALKYILKRLENINSILEASEELDIAYRSRNLLQLLDQE